MSYFIKKYLVWIGAITYFTVMLPGTALAVETAHIHDARPAAVYHCPMHPQVVSDKPGNCPICGMRLVLSDLGITGASPSIQGRVPVAISDVSQNSLDIGTSMVEMKPLEKTVEAWGQVASKREGTPAAQRPNKSGIWIYLELREKDAQFVKVGDTVMIRVPALQETAFESQISFIDTEVNAQRGTIRAKVLAQNIPTDLKYGMSVTASIHVFLGNKLVVSEKVPLFTGNRSIVFVYQDGTFTPREVVLGVEANGYYEVKEGLMAGEKVASSGNFFIDSESRLKSAVEKSAHGSHGS